MFYDVGPFFTACVDPCDKAAAWCEEWLRNSGSAAPAIQGNSAGLESKTNEDDVGARLRDILNANDVWSEVSGGDNDSLVDNILDGDWIGLMCGPNSDEAADWDAYIKDTFDSLKQYVEAEWFSPDQNDPNFKTVHIKFKPRFALGDKETQTSVLNQLGDKIADGYFAMAEKRHEALSPKMQKRLKLKAWQENTLEMKGFDEAGYSFLDLYEGGKCPAFMTPTKGYETEKEALDAAKKIFDDFDEYFEITALFDEAGGPDGEAVWFPAYGLKKTFVDLPEGEGLEVLSELSDVLYRVYTKGESAREDRRGTDRYGHHVKRFTTKDLGNTDPTFGRVAWYYKGSGSVASEYNADNLDRIVKALADMPIEKASIEKALAQFPPSIYPKRRIPHIAEFEPDIGVCRIGCHPARDIRQSYSYKDLELRWNPEGSEGNGDDAGTDDKFGLAYLDTTSFDAFSNDFSTSASDNFLHDLAQMPVSKKSIEDLLRKHQLHKYGSAVGVRDFFPDNGIAYLGTYGDDGLPYKTLCLKWGPALKK